MTPHQAWLYPNAVHPYHARYRSFSVTRTARSLGLLTALVAVSSATVVAAAAPMIVIW